MGWKRYQFPLKGRKYTLNGLGMTAIHIPINQTVVIRIKPDEHFN